MKTTFIEQEQLGLLGPALERILSYNTKRERRIHTSSFLHALRALGLVGPNKEVVYISSAIRVDGTRGLLVVENESEVKRTILNATLPLGDSNVA
jgi:hypothetical protein